MPYLFPSTIVPSNIEFVAKTNISVFASPYTGKTQVTRFQGGQWWELILSFPPLTPSEAQTLTGYLTRLGGQDGTFYYTLPDMFAMSGSVVATVLANGNDFTLSSGTPQIGLFGSDSVAKRLVQFTSATSLFPVLTAGAKTITNTGSLFRLTNNEVRFTVNEMRDYGVVIAIRETL